MWGRTVASDLNVKTTLKIGKEEKPSKSTKCFVNTKIGEEKQLPFAINN